MDTIAVRLKAFIKHKGLSVRRFEESVGMSNGSVAKLNKDIKSKYLENIYTVYPDLNGQWLLTGQGEMTKTVAESPRRPPENTSPPYKDSFSDVGGVMSAVHNMMLDITRENNENIKQLVITMMETIKEHDKNLISELHKFEESMLEKISESLGAADAHQDMGDTKEGIKEKLLL